ncbi:MAG: cell division protein ZapA [Firmicutes bacterium]|nr:cell division protein ZapA [Bacillota bacterium]
MVVEERLVKVTARIMGEEYTIRGRAPEEHILKVARYVDEKMTQVAQAYPKLGTSRVAVLTAINMADELFKIRDQYEQLTRLLEEEWSSRRAGAEPSGSRLAPRAERGAQPSADGQQPPRTRPDDSVLASGGPLLTGDALTAPVPAPRTLWPDDGEG